MNHEITIDQVAHTTCFRARCSCGQSFKLRALADQAMQDALDHAEDMVEALNDGRPEDFIEVDYHDDRKAPKADVISLDEWRRDNRVYH